VAGGRARRQRLELAEDAHDPGVAAAAGVDREERQRHPAEHGRRGEHHRLDPRDPLRECKCGPGVDQRDSVVLAAAPRPLRRLGRRPRLHQLSVQQAKVRPGREQDAQEGLDVSFDHRTGGRHHRPQHRDREQQEDAERERQHLDLEVHRQGDGVPSWWVSFCPFQIYAVASSSVN
jgi:hypothetical protein